MYALVGAAFWCVFFRDVLLSRGDLLPGDRVDSRLIMVLLEHWYKTFRGIEPWRSPNFFFPVRGVLGFSEGFFFFGGLYIPLRVIGLDMLTSYQVVLCLLLPIGYVGMALLLDRVFRVHWLTGSVCAGVSIFSSMNYIDDPRTQMWAVVIIPYLGLASMKLVRPMGPSYQLRLFPAIGTVALFALLATTSLYTTWFLVFITLLSGIPALFVCWCRLGWRQLAKPIWFFLKRNSGRLMIVVAVAAILTLPVIAIYLPVLPDQPVTDWNFVRSNLPVPVTRGVGTPLLVSFALGMFLCVASFVRPTVREAVPLSWTRRTIAFSLGMATICVWAAMYQRFGWSLWRLVFLVMPGGNVIRGVFRINQVLLGAVAVVSAIGMSTIMERKKWRLLTTTMVGVLCLWIALDNYRPAHPELSKREERNFVNSVPPPPSDCQSFAYIADRFILSPSTSIRPMHYLSPNAMGFRPSMEKAGVFLTVGH